VCFSQRTVQETKGWDVFEDPPPKADSGSMANQKCLEITVKMLKIVAYLVTFVIVLGSGVIAKGTMLFMTSQLRKDRILPYCSRDIGTCGTKLSVVRFLLDVIPYFLRTW
jgi:chitin synthase